MRAILDRAGEWAREQRPYALAVLVSAYASAPRELGASMIVDAEGTVFGNVSAGCVDGAVHDLCTQAIASGEVTRARYGIADGTAFAAGLTCGGVIDVLVIPVLPGSSAAATLTSLHEAVERREPCALGVVTDGAGGGALVLSRAATSDQRAAPGTHDDGVRAALAADLLRLRSDAHPIVLRYTSDAADIEVLGIPFAHPPRLIIVGAVEFSVALSRLGAASGFEVTVCDPRDVFATAERFPAATEVSHRWPHEYLAETPIDENTAICVLTHDDRFDVPALTVALRSRAGYVGAMGSRRTHDDRSRRLRDAGVTDAETARLRSPIGLALGGRTPEETALSILAEIVMVRAGGTGAPLREQQGPVHPSRIVASEPGAASATAGGPDDSPFCPPGIDAVIARWDATGRRH